MKQNSGSNPTARKPGGLPPLVLILAVSAMLSGCAYIPESWKEGGFPWDVGGQGKWASSVGQETSDAQETPETQETQAPEIQPKPEDPARKAVTGVQTRLAKLGYQPGPVDGIAGSATQAAIRHYQKDAGLPVDGKVSEKLVARLRRPAPPRSEITPPEPKSTTLVIGYRNSNIQPDYAAGDAYAWSDGAVERVLRTRGDTVWWSRTGGMQYSTSRGFVLPMQRWKTPSGSGRTAVDTDAAGAWPAASGAALSFTVQLSEGDNDVAALAQDWTCSRTGSGKTAVPAGAFGTVTITCERTGAAPDAWRKRVWYYAPAVRHYVRRDDYSGSSEEPQRVELIAVRLGAKDWPPAVRGGLDQAIQKSLANKALGEQTKWKSTAVEYSFVIQPTGESKRYGWDRCRTYVVERMTPESPRAWPGLACRAKGSDRWIIPVLDEKKGVLATAPLN